MSMTYAIDFDGCIAQNEVLDPRAAKCLQMLKAAGHRLILWSCRCNPLDDSPNELVEVSAFYATGTLPGRVEEQWERYTTMRQLLKAWGLWDLFDVVWQAPGKPVADVYVDDKASAPDWGRIYSLSGGIT